MIRSTIFLIAFTIASCSATQNKAVAQDALTASQMLCVLASSFTDDAAIAEACAIDKALVPLVRPVLAARASRVHQCKDAGSD